MLEFSHLSWRGVTFGDAVVIGDSRAESLTDRTPVAGIYRREAFRPTMTGSANFAYRTTFILYLAETTQYALADTKLDLMDYMDGIRDNLLWVRTSDNATQMTFVDAELVAIDPAPPAGQSDARFTEGLTVSFISGRPRLGD